MSVKKAKGKGKKAAKKSAKKSTPKAKKPVDMVQVRENINDLVRDSAEAIAIGVITVAKTGQLASAKYLFEVVGLYPATEQTAATPAENSLAYTLLARMGLPLEPVIVDEELLPPIVTGDEKAVRTEATPSDAEEDPAKEGERGPHSAEDDEQRPDGSEGLEDTVE